MSTFIAFINASPAINNTESRGWWASKNSGNEESEDLLRAPIYKDDDRSPEEYAEEFEGDIIMSGEEMERFAKTGIVGENFRWSKGVVPYVIDPRYSKITIIFII